MIYFNGTLFARIIMIAILMQYFFLYNIDHANASLKALMTSARELITRRYRSAAYDKGIPISSLFLSVVDLVS